MTGDVVSADLEAKYETKSAYGALLLTAYPIIRQRYYYEGLFRTWVKDNLAALMKSPMAFDLRKYGMFVVRQTYARKRCTITAWSTPSKQISLRFSLEASGIGNLATKWGVER
jgi:hypothetical protein